jgi:predicted transcriptional regulator
MSTNDTNKADGRSSLVAEFLAGRGPNPIPETKRGSGPLTKKFIRETMAEVAAQDRVNQSKAATGVLEDLMATMRLISDNRDLIRLIESRKFNSVSELAVAMGRELPNVSRTLSRMAAYGLIGYQEHGADARAKKPVWLAPALSDHEEGDWVQAYCLAMAVKMKIPTVMTDVDFSIIERVVRDAVDSTAEKISAMRPLSAAR